MNTEIMVKNRRVVEFCVCFALLLSFTSRTLGQTSQPKPQKAAKAEEDPTKQPAPFLEDWTNLSLKNSSLRMTPPELADKRDVASEGFIRERYQVSWRPKDPFDLYVIRPRGVARPPVILYLYSFPEDTDQFKNDFWCETAVGGGYAAVGFVGAITGHRMRYRLPKEWFVSEMQEALGSTVHDVELILDYLGTRKDLDASHVGMFGLGSGGAVAIMASAADSRIRVLDLLGPWGDWPKWTAESKAITEEERPKFVKAEFLAKIAPLEPISWLPKSQAKSMRIQDVRGNKAMPDEAQVRLETAAPEFAVINQYGNGRALLAKQPAGDLFQWIKEQLKTDAQTQIAREKSERIHFYPAIQLPEEKWPNVGTLELGKTTSTAKSKPANEKEKPNE